MTSLHRAASSKCSCCAACSIRSSKARSTSRVFPRSICMAHWINSLYSCTLIAPVHTPQHRPICRYIHGLPRPISSGNFFLQEGIPSVFSIVEIIFPITLILEYGPKYRPFSPRLRLMTIRGYFSSVVTLIYG